MTRKTEPLQDFWCTPSGKTIACKEKIKVMGENMNEIKQYLQDAIDDAVLMGCSEESFRQAYIELIKNLRSQYPEQRQAQEEDS